MFSQSEENYLKTICGLELSLNDTNISTNLIAEKLKTKASSVTDMIKRLAKKDLVDYQKYKGVSLTRKGNITALSIIRKHRLWECFLVEKLNFKWDEVHEIAEQLEHIQSDELVNRLDEFMNFPKNDPHGDPIPDVMGIIVSKHNKTLSSININEKCKVVGVKDSSNEFLKFLEKIKIGLGSIIIIKEIESFDHSLLIKVNDKSINISNQIASNIYINLIE